MELQAIVKKGWTYLVQWMEGGRVRTESVGTSKKLAERLKKLKEYELNSGIASSIKAIRFPDFRAEELKVLEGRAAPKTLVEVARILRDFAEVARPHWVKDITTSMVEGYMAAISRKVRPATLNHHLRVLKASFNRAVKRNYIRENPADIAKVKEPEKSIRVLSAEEVEKLLDACPNQQWRTARRRVLEQTIRQNRKGVRHQARYASRPQAHFCHAVDDGR